MTIAIHHVSSPQRLAQVEEILDAQFLYRKGTDETLFYDFHRRSDADLAIVNLNYIPGIKAELFQHL